MGIKLFRKNKSRSDINFFDGNFTLKEIFRYRKLKSITGNFFRVLIFVLILSTFLIQIDRTKANNLSFSQSEISNSFYSYSNIDTLSGNDIRLQKGSVGSWDNSDAPIDLKDTTYYPDIQYGPSNTIYALAGNYTGHFMRYWIDERRWEDLAPLPFSNYSRLTFDGSRYFYALATTGYNFYRYDSFTDVWEKLPETPNELSSGSTLEYTTINGGTIYAFRGGNSGYFWRFSIIENKWYDLPALSYLITNGSSMMWDRGDFIYMTRGGYVYHLYRYQISTGQWTDRYSSSSYLYDSSRVKMIYLNSNQFIVMDSAGRFSLYNVSTNSFTALGYPTGVSVGAMAGAFDGASKFYALIGPNENNANMRVYDINTKQWDNGATTMGDPNEYSAYAFDGGDNFYEIKGTTSFLYRKNLSTNVGTYLSPPMVGIYPYSSASYTNNKIYVIKGNGYSNFYSYDVASNDWDSELAPIPATTCSGANLVDGQDGYLYLTRGCGTATFYRYNLAANTWAAIANSPTAFELGGSLVKVGNFLYGFAGYDYRDRVVKFNLTTQTWSEENIGPMGIGWPYGGRVTSDGDSKIYLMPGDQYTDLSESSRFYSYDINTKQWQRLADFPDYARGNSKPYLFYRQNSVYCMSGSFDNRLQKWSPGAGSNFVTGGTFYSKHYDLIQASSFDRFNYSVSGSGTTTVYTRSSDNLANWDGWVQLNGGNQIQSQPKRYFQYKIVISGDGTSTPIVSNVSLDYSQETTPPANPTEFKAYSEKGGALLTLAGNPRYPYHHPYFEWNAPSDGLNGSGVDGYYVYFGPDDRANPATAGNFQKTTSYTADTPMSAGDIDYLIISVKDKLGNISTPAQLFSYRYWFVSPPNNVTVDSQSEFQEGAGAGIDLLSEPGNAALVSKPNGSWVDGDLAKIPQTFRGGAAVYANGSIYVEMGNGTKYFYRFDLEANQWARIADSPDTSSSSAAGSVLCFDGNDTIYLIVGGTSIAFEKYSISRNTWTKLNDLPTPAGAESSMAMISGGKFMMTLAYSTFNYIYDPITDTIEENVPAPGNFVTASNLYFDGNDSVYTMTESNWLRKFVISENRWYTLLQAPAYMLDSQNIAFDGIGSDLYFFINRNSKDYNAWRYSITEGRFYTIPSQSMETSSTAYVVSDKKRYVYIFHNVADSYHQDNMFIKYDTQLQKYTPDLYTPDRGYNFARSTSAGGYVNYGAEDSWPFYSSDWSSFAYDSTDLVYFKTTNLIGAYSVSQKRLVKESRIPYSNNGHLVYLNGYIYNEIDGTNRFIRLNTTTWEWQELATSPGTFNRIYSDNNSTDKEGRIYITQGGSSKNVYRYTPSSNTWETLPVAPYAISHGLSMVYDGSQYIYFTFSSSTSAFYKLNTLDTTNTVAGAWGTALAPVIDITPGGGSSTVLTSGKIFLMKGKATKKMSVYTIATNSWVDGVDAPTEVTNSGGILKINDQYALLYPAGAKSAVWRFNFPSVTNGNSAYGVYTSKNFLIEGVFSYVNLESDVVLPANTSITFQTRTTPDGSVWSDWQDTGELKLINNQKIISQIQSPIQKNIQVRAILQSYDNYNTPVINNFKINYYSDTNPPSAPTTIKVYSDSSLNKTELVSNTWYNHATPLVDWPEPGEAGGATDGLIGSNISGYYVYMGSDENAVPQTSGVFVNQSQYQPALTQSGLNYINIQSVDASGNVSTDIYKAFLYKFDNEKPQKPGIISVNPAGYSRNNKFTFNWASSYDGFSGVDEYCYKTGASDGIYATEQCQKENHLDEIPAAYQEGSNVIIIRTKDLAGNYSDLTTEATFYYSTNAPTPVTNLSVSTVGQNLYNFTWSPPLSYSGDVNKLSYYYSINAQPSESNTIRIETAGIERLPAATQPGTNQFYVVAKDESGNVNWVSYATISFFSNTTAPGSPLNVTIADISSRSSNRWGLALTWDKPTSDGSGTDCYYIERSIDKLKFNRVGEPKTNSFVDNTVEEGKKYYYRIRSVDSVGDQSGPSSIVDGTPVGKFVSPPVMSEPKIEVGSSKVTIKWQTDRPSSGYVSYGSIYNKLIDSKGSLESTTEHTVVITGLNPNAVFYYQLQSFESEREYSLDQSFSVLRTFKTKPAATIQNVKVDNITLKEARIGWQSPSSVSYKILYGKNTTYGLSKEGEATGENQSVVIDNLEDTSVYNFKITTITIDGDEIVSDNYTLQTIAYPLVSDIRFQPIESSINQVEISWKTNVKTTSAVSYQFDANIKEEVNNDFVTDHKIVISNLADNAQYKVYIKGKDEYGNSITSDQQTWKTNVDTKAPEITKIRVEPVVSTAGDKAQLIVSWETDEPSTSQVEYGLMDQSKKFVSKTAQDISMNYKHTVIISNLEPAKIYHVRPLSSDRSGNIAYGEDTISVVGQKDMSVFTVILNALQNVFGWLKFGK